MKSVLVRWVVLMIAVWAATYIVPGIGYANWQSLVVAALVLSVLNSFVKPLLVALSFPFVILTLGFFLLVINALLLWLTSYLVKGFQVEGFWSALGASLIISVISLFLGQATVPRRPPRTRPPPPGKGPIIDVEV